MSLSPPGWRSTLHRAGPRPRLAGLFYIGTAFSCATKKSESHATARERTWGTQPRLTRQLRYTFIPASSQNTYRSVNHLAGWVPLAGCFDPFSWHEKKRFLYRTPTRRRCRKGACTLRPCRRPGRVGPAARNGAPMRSHWILRTCSRTED